LTAIVYAYKLATFLDILCSGSKLTDFLAKVLGFFNPSDRTQFRCVFVFTGLVKPTNMVCSSRHETDLQAMSVSAVLFIPSFSCFYLQYFTFLYFLICHLQMYVENLKCAYYVFHFYARKQLLLSARLSHCNSVCPSVCHTGGSVKNGAR